MINKMESAAATRRDSLGKNHAYVGGLLAFLLSLGLLLFTVVEMRRGILFTTPGYFKIGSPSIILYVAPIHFILLALAAIGIFISYRYISQWEKKNLVSGNTLKSWTILLAAAIFIFLIVDLFIYRGVPAARIVSAGKLGIGKIFNVEGFPLWLQPILSAINYLALVWHATLLGIFIGALFLILIGGYFKKIMGKEGFLSHLAGSALALPQPFCSCCAAPVGATLYRSGVGLGPMLAFTVSSPMLNITSLILASILLPLNFALLRIIGGIITSIFATYAVSILAKRWVSGKKREVKKDNLTVWSLKVVDQYGKLFHFENLMANKSVDTPVSLLSLWVNTAWHLGKVVVPVLFIGAIITSAVVMVLPSPGNSLSGIILASAFGTLLMVPTWTEMAVAGTFLSSGLTGPAAAILLTLPSVSIPCLIIVGSAVGSSRVAILLGLFIFIIGILSGLTFL